MMLLFLLVVIAALVLAILGILIEGMFYLLIIGAIVLIADVALLALRSTRRRRPLR
ncbi:hypothetical protein [Actinomadura sp. KC06]|uniref:hypothetical protein n=1 Tax=Actinomadura sp. KC06 TaxID=2530369 RepID=UPI00140508CB|nr:hypothetical protein [Actinomadura sp. KC06]